VHGAAADQLARLADAVLARVQITNLLHQERHDWYLPGLVIRKSDMPPIGKPSVHSGLIWQSPRQMLTLCALLDLIGLALVAAGIDRLMEANLLQHPGWLLAFGLTYISCSWLFGSYTLLRWPRLPLMQVMARLGAAALFTVLSIVLVVWLLHLPPVISLGHRRIQLALMSFLSLWALGARLLLRLKIRDRQRPAGTTVLARVERRQQRLLPSLLPEEALTFEDVPWQETLSVQRQLKRAADLVIAISLLLITCPLVALAALCIWLEDGGSALYLQERSGLMGRKFRVYKLRSMRMARPDEPPTWTLRRDQRITRVGSVLRRLRLDELPQLLNVLRGEMSLIGPRPERPELEHPLEATIPHYRKRHWMPPGLSGWAQVCAPYASSVEEAELKLSYDLFYLKHWNTGLDLLILLKTVKTVLKAKGR
jgi:lipopolysaccharide/colanic/teichoic acid biosynthesis glycosyltransferase